MVPTIRDVAEKAGVSIATVSRVLNKSASVGEAKRQRVEAVAEELGYSANPAAASLRGQSTGGIGVLLPYIAGDFFSGFLRGIDRYTSDRGKFLMVSSSHRNVEEMKAIVQGMNRRVDGMVVMSTEVPARTVCEWVPKSMPIVFVNTEVEDPGIEAFNFDNRGGARRMTEHLIGQGHERIGFLRGPEGSCDAEERLAGYREAMAAAGLEPGPEVQGNFFTESGEDAASVFLAMDPRPTAIFAANDDSACGLLSGFREAGVDVPGDIALAGFDDIPLSSLLTPSLSTVRVPAGEIGRAAIERLADLIDGTNGHGQGVVVHPTEIIVRESTAA